MKYKATNDITYYFLLEESIFNRLKTLGWEKGIHRYEDYNLKFDVICFFVNLISYRSAMSHKISEDGYVQLNAQILKKYHSKYKTYLDFLEKHEFIKVRTYSILKSRSKGYKLILAEKPLKIIRYVPEDFIIRKKLSQDKLNKKGNADKTTGHLTKWLASGHLNIQYEESLKFLEETKMLDSKKYSRRYLIEMLHHNIIYYQRQGKDNRLHSILSNCPKDLRNYICYRSNQSLVSLDIKSSQPFLLAGILNLLFLSKNDSSNSKRIEDCIYSIVDKDGRDKICQSISTMMQVNLKEPDITGIEQYVNLVTEGDLYNYIAKNLSEDFLHKIQTPLGISDQFFNQRLEYKEWIHFDNLRDYAKKAVMEYLYSSTKNKEKRCKEVRRILPDVVSRVVDEFKAGDKTYFPIFLQNLEATLILDKITGKIAFEYPDVPLFTIHDSIITTANNAAMVRQQLEKGLNDFFGIAPIISVEEWSLNTRVEPP